MDNIPPADNEIISLMNVNVRHEEPSNKTPSTLTIPVTVIPKTSTATITTIPPPIPLFIPHPHQSTPTPIPTPIPPKTTIPILPKAVSDFATPLIKITVIESLKDVVLAKSSSQPQSTYEAAISSKGTTRSQPKSSGKSAQANEPIHMVDDTEVQQDQGQDMGNTDDQPNVEAASKYDRFKKPERPLTRDSDWNVRKSVDFRPPQTWIRKIAQEEKTPLSFDELIRTPIDFSAYVMNHLKIDNLTQDHLIRPVFNLLKGTCKSHVELEYNIEECYKVVTDRLDWNNPEGKKYPFDLSKPPPLIMDRGRQVVPVDYFINNDLEYLRGGSLSRKYTTSTTKTKVDKYDASLGSKEISNLERDVIFNLGVALQMFTRRIVILKRVKDLQLGVKSYQNKLNITMPETFRMDYLPKRRWSSLDRKRSRIMIKAIDKKLLERRLMRSLEKFAGGRDYGEDLRLLQRTI
ncbi:hypothetical protein Tco_0559027 [Tanacetum coccineum]